MKIELRTVVASNNISTMENHQTPKADPDFQRFFCYKQKQQQSNEERSFQVRIVKYFVVKLKKNEESHINLKIQQSFTLFLSHEFGNFCDGPVYMVSLFTSLICRKEQIFS